MPEEKPKKIRKPRSVAEAPRPDGTVTLTIRTAYTAEQIEARKEDIASLEAQLEVIREKLARLKAQDGRRSSAEKVRVQVDPETMVVTNADTGEQVHPSKMSSLQWKLAIEAAKATK